MPRFDASNGLLLTFDRDMAKRLFATKGDEPLRSFLHELITDAPEDSPDVLSLDGCWSAVHGALCGGDASPNAGQPPLNQCILGGRPMHSSEQMTVRLVRPDMVQHVVTAADQTNIDGLQEHYTNLSAAGEWDVGKKLIENVFEHFRYAAQQRAAVVFFVIT